MSSFRSVVLDVDSTLCGIEGIDWLARRRGADVARLIAQTTERAMNGELPLDAVYGERLAIVKPGREDIEALADAYRASLAVGAAETIRALRARDVRLTLVSGGLRQAILPLATDLEFAPEDVCAVAIRCDDEGRYLGFDEASPLTRQAGKLEVVRAAELPGPVLAVGDGATDLAMRPGVDAFAAFTGFVERPAVVAGADHVVSSFRDLLALVTAA